MILFAAIEQDGEVYVGAKGERHCHVIASMVNAGLKPPIKGIQGFVNSYGTFLNRHDAAKEAFECGQLVDKTCPDIILSEDLW